MLKRKGITPVIATVLLLGITFAIGAILFTQVEGLLQDTAEGEKISNIQGTDMRLSPVYASGNPGHINVSVRNIGEKAINTSDFNIVYGPPGESGVLGYGEIETTGVYDTVGPHECFSDDPNAAVVNPGETYTCSTGLEFPNTLQEVDIVVRASGFEKSWDTTCKPLRDGSTTC